MGDDMYPVAVGVVRNAPAIIAQAAKSPLGVASLALLVSGLAGVALFRDADMWPRVSAFAILIIGLLGIVFRVVHVAGQARSSSGGGRGGDAYAVGDDSRAVGGQGGAAHGRRGGDGGNAKVTGNRSVAKGGAGGAG